MLTWIWLPSMLHPPTPTLDVALGERGTAEVNAALMGFPPSPPRQYPSSESNSCHLPNGVQGFAGQSWELAQPIHKLPEQATNLLSPILAERGILMHRNHQGSQP